MFTPRTTIPEDNNPYYTITSVGGLNEAIAGNPPAWNGSALSNCVGYGWGRLYEILGSRPNIEPVDAYLWWNTTAYPKSQFASLGAVAVWSGGEFGTGHIAIVEIMEGGVVSMSNSDYGGRAFYMTNFTEGTYNIPGLTFMGFINVPIPSSQDVNGWYIFFHNRG